MPFRRPQFFLMHSANFMTMGYGVQVILSLRGCNVGITDEDGFIK
jgi:hypothetical protein